MSAFPQIIFLRFKGVDIFLFIFFFFLKEPSRGKKIFTEKKARFDNSRHRSAIFLISADDRFALSPFEVMYIFLHARLPF